MAMTRKIGTIFKNLRKQKNFTVEQISIKLQAKGYNVTPKTLYAYESNSRAMGVDTFLALCQIYSCKNVLEIFGDVDVDYSIPDDQTLNNRNNNLNNLMKRYDSLNKEGRERLLNYADDLVSSGKYIKSDQIPILENNA